MTEGVAYLQFFTRLEKDGTYTLCLDSSTADDVPQEIGRGFDSVPGVIQAIIAALTAPAVAEDRITSLEEYKPALNDTIDAVNEAGEAITKLAERLAALEEWREELSRGGAAFAPPTRPRIPKPGELRQPAGNPGLRAPAATRQVIVPDVLQRPGTVVGPSTLDEPRPDFERGSFKPHSPVARVSRGPNSVD